MNVCVGGWSVRELKRQIGSVSYERTALSRDKEALRQHVKSLSETEKPELILRDSALLEAISRVLDEHMVLKNPRQSKNPLLLSQKGGLYSPNTQQDYKATMLREWSGIDRANSHSGHRTLTFNLFTARPERAIAYR